MRPAPAAALAALALVLAAVSVAGCGESELTVSAASSLKAPLTDYGERFDGAEVRLSFSGSDQLAAQIRAGARPDVFVSADVGLPLTLRDEGLLEEPVKFASNRLVVAVPAEDARVEGVADLGKPGIRIAVGTRSVPVGAYASEALLRLPPAVGRNVLTREPDVSGVVAKLRAGAVDAGFVYATDVTATGGRLRAIELPPEARPEVSYAAAVVRGSERAAEARRFVRGLVEGPGRAALTAAGFEPPR